MALRKSSKTRIWSIRKHSATTCIPLTWFPHSLWKGLWCLVLCQLQTANVADILRSLLFEQQLNYNFFLPLLHSRGVSILRPLNPQQKWYKELWSLKSYYKMNFVFFFALEWNNKEQLIQRFRKNTVFHWLITTTTRKMQTLLVNYPCIFVIMIIGLCESPAILM